MPGTGLHDPWRRHREDLRRFVARRIFDRHEAEDIVQEALTRAHEAQHQLRSPERLPAWLARIAANLIVDHHRARRPSDELPEDLAAPETEDDPVARLAPCLPGMLDELPETYRNALRWSELEGLPQREVAQRLGLSWSGAKSRVQRARTLLRARVEACCRVLMAGRTIAGFERRAKRQAALQTERQADCRGCDRPAATSAGPRLRLS